jgi:hypothetical protein
LGFLTIIEHEAHGLFGGYLLLNLAGRPLEFHCTAPIKPNRAQEILYGPTLAPYMYGEHIGRSLAQKASVEPLLICTDREPALALREFVTMPVVLLAADACSEHAAGEKALRVDEPHKLRAPLLSVVAGRNRVAIKASQRGDEALVAERLAELGEEFDLAEPFLRIRDAIDEAQRVGR